MGRIPKSVNLEDFEVKEFLCKAKKNGGKAGETLPNLGFSLSGGGARALSVTASILDAFDSRNEKAKEAKVGGILQLANYAAGVSGSSWLLGSWATSNFPRITTLDWKLDEENDLWDWNVAKHYLKVYKIVKQKKKAGFPVGIVDAWAVLLNRHFINDPQHEDPPDRQSSTLVFDKANLGIQGEERAFRSGNSYKPAREEDGIHHRDPTCDSTAVEYEILVPMS
ncbi:hypothetical protein Pst134EB_016242 [Puccinia striiformis f. sp. tritici]|nr:hypothetical protein Pst134EB_016242 [Puccinia striiformis f. sp. tritici]